MNHYLYKLVPPRPTFFLDMTEAESTIIRDHVSYWTGLAHDGTAADPAITAELATFEVYPMPGAITRP